MLECDSARGLFRQADRPINVIGVESIGNRGKTPEFSGSYVDRVYKRVPQTVVCGTLAAVTVGCGVWAALWCYLGGATLKADARSRSFAVLLVLRSSRALESGLLKYVWSFSPMADS